MNQNPKHRSALRWLTVLSALLGLTVRAHAGGVPCRYDVIATIQGPECPPHGPAHTFVTAISPNGQYACGYYTPCGIGQHRGWYWTVATGLVTIPLPNGLTHSDAYDVSDAGLVVGEYQGVPDGSNRGFIYDINAGQFVALLTGANPAQGRCSINAINSGGTVCGWRSIGSPNDPSIPYQAFLWSQKTGYIDLGIMNGPNSSALDISDSGVVVGWTGSGQSVTISNARAFVRNGSNLSILSAPPGSAAIAYSVSQSGKVIVYAQTQQSPIQAAVFIYQWGSWTILPNAGFGRTFGSKISASGLVAGACGTLSTPVRWHASLWDQNSVRLLETVSTVPVGASFQFVVDVSSTGIAVIGGQNADDDYLVYVLAPQPSRLGDTDCNDMIDIDDLVSVIIHWGPCESCAADINDDQIVNVVDLVTVIQNWTISG